MHHDQPVAHLERLVHIVGDHQGSQSLLLHDLARQSGDQLGALRVQGGGVLIEQQHFGPGIGGHQQTQSLPLTTRKQSDFGFESVLQTELQDLQRLGETLPLP